MSPTETTKYLQIQNCLIIENSTEIFSKILEFLKLHHKFMVGNNIGFRFHNCRANPMNNNLLEILNLLKNWN